MKIYHSYCKSELRARAVWKLYSSDLEKNFRSLCSAVSSLSGREVNAIKSLTRPSAFENPIVTSQHPIRTCSCRRSVQSRVRLQRGWTHRSDDALNSVAIARPLATSDVGPLHKPSDAEVCLLPRRSSVDMLTEVTRETEVHPRKSRSNNNPQPYNYLLCNNWRGKWTI